jgi:glucose-1-phosphatase
MPIAPADALLFDLGRVVIDIDFKRCIARWADHARCDPRLIEERFRRDFSYRRHEVGEIDTKEFFAGLQLACEIELSHDQFLEGWNAIFVGEMPGISGALATAAAKLPIYAFSNTNRPHQNYFMERFADVLGNFRQVFASSDVGLRKPDADAFQFVVGAIGVPARRILFFDDSLANVEGARACGLQAVHVASRSTVHETLARVAGTVMLPG